MRRIHIIGRKNSGKTTLVVNLVRCLTSQGLRVGSIKHTHHHHELDVPGKDSHRHREAGAALVGILSPDMNAVFWRRDSLPLHESAASSSASDAKYAPFEPLFADCDLVLVEGDVQATAPRIEIWRAVVGAPPYAAEDTTIRMLVTDAPDQAGLPADSPTELFPLDDLTRLAARLHDLARAH